MLFGQDRNKLRQFYCDTWAARRQGLPLEPLQLQIAEVIEQHPEYQPLVEKPDQALARDYLPELGESNPFLHMGMHLAIREQVATNRPAGMRESYQRLLMATGDSHQLEHQCMDCLAEMIWNAQKQGAEPDENAYITCIRSLLDTEPHTR